jgi:uncharacterized protein (TIRG00374 family)
VSTIENNERLLPESLPLAKRTTLRRAATLIVLGALTVLVILKLSGFKASWETFRALDPRYLACAFAVYYFSFLVRTLRWRLLLRSLGQKLSIPALFSYLLVGWFVNAVVPARAGDVARGYLLRSDRKIPLRAGLSSIFVERGLDGLVILGCALFFSFFIRSLGLPQWILSLYQMTFSLLLLALVFLYFVPKLENKVRGLSPSARYQKVVLFLFRLLDNVRLIAKNPTRLILALACTIVIWLCDVLVTYLVLLGLGYTMPLPWMAFISFTVNLVAIIPITPGAVGQIDAVQFSLFSLIGVPREFGGVTILVSRFICYWSFLLVSGLVTYGSGLFRLVRMMSGRKKLMVTSLESVTTTEN